MYTFGVELGAGAFSTVKEAKHKETGKEVAIKVLDKYEDDDEQTQKFKSEIDIISNLKHENIVAFYELDEDDENFYVVMELVGGGELFDYIIHNKCIPEIESACVIAQVLKAIEYMHNIGIAHRDLKPENLLFKGKDAKIIKIADFGESKSYKENTLSTYCGTPDYMAPEIIRGDPYGPTVDIWSIGVISYVMLGGFPPFDGDNDVEVFASILSVKYDFPNPEWTNITTMAQDFIRSIFVPADQRLSASQCLAHPWIVTHVPVEMRTNVAASPVIVEKKETSSGLSSRIPSVQALGGGGGSSGGEGEDEGMPSGKKKKKDKGKVYSLTSPSVVMVGEEEDLNMKDPKKQILEAITDLLKTSTSTPEYLHLSGELRTMMHVLQATSGIPSSAGNSSPKTDLENTIYGLYWDRVKELRTLRKGYNARTPMSARTPSSAHKATRKKEKKV